MKNSYIVTIVVVGILLGAGLLAGLARDGYMNKIQNIAKNASVEQYLGPFINYGFMSGTLVIDHATVGLEVNKFVVDPDEIPKNGDEYYANVIDQCIFHSTDSFDPLCVICRLKDASGNVIGPEIEAKTIATRIILFKSIFPPALVDSDLLDMCYLLNHLILQIHHQFG